MATRQMRGLALWAVTFFILTVSPVLAGGNGMRLPNHAELTAALDGVCKKEVNNGAIFSPCEMWAAVVGRSGGVVTVAKTSGTDPWPGSRVISMQKANTANAFSNRSLALSTANLYSAVQPGGSLYGLQFSNPVDTAAAYRGLAKNYGGLRDPAVGHRVGGVNVFGGGLALYHPKTGEVLGALGVSGDSSCADHNIAWRIRHKLGLDKVPGGVNKGSYGGATAPAKGDDNIIYELGNGFAHPYCGFGEKKVADLPSRK